MSTDDDLGMDVPHERLPVPVPSVYTRTGEPVPDEHASEVWHANYGERHVAYTEVRLPGHGERVVLSTVFLGLDAGMGLTPKPLLFESEVFGSHLDRHVERYPSEEASRVGHVELLARLMLDLNGGAIPGRGQATRHAPPTAPQQAQEAPVKPLTYADARAQHEAAQAAAQPPTAPTPVQDAEQPVTEPPGGYYGQATAYTGSTRIPRPPQDAASFGYGHVDDPADVEPEQPNAAGQPVDPAAPTTGPVQQVRLPEFPPMSVDEHDDEPEAGR